MNAKIFCVVLALVLGGIIPVYASSDLVQSDSVIADSSNVPQSDPKCDPDAVPVITIFGQVNMELVCGSSFSDAGADAVDSCGLVNVVSSGFGSVNVQVPGTYFIEYNAQNAIGWAQPATRSITVLHSPTVPVVYLIGSASVSHACGTPYVDAGATATDSCGALLNVTTTGTVNVNAQGDYILVYNAINASGPAVSVTRTVTVGGCACVPAAIPVITLNGAGTLNHPCGTPYVDAGATASDSCGAVTVTTAGAVNVNASGTYTLVYTAANAAGPAVSVTRTVTVTGCQVVEGEGEPVEGEGEAEETGCDGCAGCDGNKKLPGVNKRLLGDWLLVGISFLVLATLTGAYKRMS